MLSPRAIAALYALCFVALIAFMSDASPRHVGGGAGAAPPGFDCSTMTVSYGTAFKYNSNYPSKDVESDIWFNTWDDMGNYLTASNDILNGWNGAGFSANLVVSRLTTFDTTTTGSVVNSMGAWGTAGQTGGDGLDFKASGLISVHGTLFLGINRATPTTPSFPYQYQLSNNNITSSTNHGATFNPAPTGTGVPYASPTFSGTVMSEVDFLQYGQDYTGQTADNSANFVYAYSTEGPYNNANSVYLGRYGIASDPKVAANWTFYQGGDGMLSGSWSNTWPPHAIMSGSKLFGASVGTQYLPTLQCYVKLNWWYPSVTAGTGLDTTNTNWQGYAAEHPWGRDNAGLWALVGAQKAWTSEPGVGLFSPHIMPASVASAGPRSVTAMAIAAGDYNNQGGSTGDYTLTLVPVTFTIP